jgi:very-short-patch-repair endonuclease
LSEAKPESLGVITFNIAQKELIEDLIYQRGAQDPEFREAMEQAGGGDEPFLIRNLENIQGEQRDVIFISCTYGPGVCGGQVAQRFGPVNSVAGPRRLNVMFTRSKRRMVVFSSMRPDQVQADPGEKTGRGYLRRFLQYAQSGVLEVPVNLAKGGVVPDSDFENAVGEFLRGAGYVVDIQVGVAGFSIDIGLRHPQDMGRFFMGVECDGATYHSSKTARDRDRLREEVLRDRGWKLERVWSTDWFHNRKSAQKRLLEAIAVTLSKTKVSSNRGRTALGASSPTEAPSVVFPRRGDEQRELIS